MTVRVKSKLEKIGSGTGLLMGIIAFNLLAPLLFEKREGFDVIQMVAAIACAMLCSELGARLGRLVDERGKTKN